MGMLHSEAHKVPKASSTDTTVDTTPLKKKNNNNPIAYR